MKSLNSSKSHRLFDLVPSVKPSVVSVILLFVCGVLWVKNETTNERLIALESRLYCFSCVKSGSTENLDKMTLSPKKTAQNIITRTYGHLFQKESAIRTQVGYSLSCPTGNVQTSTLIWSSLSSGQTSRKGFFRFFFFFGGGGGG